MSDRLSLPGQPTLSTRSVAWDQVRPGHSGLEAIEAALTCRLSEAVAAAASAVPICGLRLPNRARRPIARARQLAVYLSHVGFGRRFDQIAVAFGRDRTTIRHACVVMEDRRDDPAFDLALTHLEASMIRWVSRFTESAR